jgi:hypothetical protein
MHSVQRHPGFPLLTLALLLALLVLALLAREVHGQAAGDTLVNYGLAAPPSEFDWGCMGACACPVFIQAPMSGAFTLVRRATDPATQATTYDVRNVHWKAPRSDGATSVMLGSGVYTRMATDPPTDRMTLDLAFDGGPVQHFDSGVRQVGVSFPEIRTELRLHESICFDSLLAVDANPQVAACTCDPEPVTRLLAFPNPFAGSTSFAMSLPRAGQVTLAIYDAAGRRVRTLASGEAFEGGLLARGWDGRREDGAPAPPGYYMARLDAPGARWTRPIVKLAR